MMRSAIVMIAAPTTSASRARRLPPRSQDSQVTRQGHVVTKAKPATGVGHCASSLQEELSHARLPCGTHISRTEGNAVIDNEQPEQDFCDVGIHSSYASFDDGSLYSARERNERGRF